MKHALLAAVLSSLIAFPAAALTVQELPAAQTQQECMDRAKTLRAVQAQGMDARILNPEQNERWRAYDNANSPQPDPAGFTYLLSWTDDLPAAVIVAFGPDGCFAYYARVPKDTALEITLGRGA